MFAIVAPPPVKDKASALGLGSLLAFILSSSFSVSLCLCVSQSSYSLFSSYALSPLCLLHTLRLFLPNWISFLAVSLVIISPLLFFLLSSLTLSCLLDVCSSPPICALPPLPLTPFLSLLHVSIQAEYFSQ